jgi:hypothetical protein
MVVEGTLPIARAIYDWGKRNGCVREFPFEKAQMGVLPTVFVNLTEEGIKVQGLRFVLPNYDQPSPESNNADCQRPPISIEANEWLSIAKGACRKVEVGIDSTTINFVWLRYRPPGGSVVCIKCDLSSEHSGWMNFSWAEYGIHRKKLLKGADTFEEEDARDIRAWAGAAVNRVTRTAIAQTEPMREGMTATAQIAGAAERRANEATLLTVEDGSSKKPTPPIGIPGDQFFDPNDWPAPESN